jgi:UDP-N-acetylmuramoyl-L-alanyl-D-glutamate--2,6-diaminopimelate ligase
VAYGVGNDIHPQIHHMTNVGVPELMKRLKWMKSQGVEWLVLETTSHALAQNRVWGVPYSVAVMTNVTHEHLDYHKTFERYRDAKIKLFKLAAANKHGLRLGVVNAEDPSAKKFMTAVPHAISYGVGKGSLSAANVRATPQGSSFTATFDGSQDPGAHDVVFGGGVAKKDQAPRKLQLTVNIPGSFNISNALAAASTGIAIGLTDTQIEQGIAALSGVEGRMTNINEGQDYSVIVDFAHTPDSFEKLFKDLKPIVKGRLIVMFGSAGRRDEAKRAVQGKLAGTYADAVVITEEDDRDIDGKAIMAQIAKGAEKAGKVRGINLFLVHDRTEAIAFTMSLAHKDDTVLLLGKGHEKTIERANGENPWDEIGAAHDAIKAQSAKKPHKTTRK